MIPRSAGSTSTESLGPVAIVAATLLLVAAPLLRGGNREIALVALEGIALLFLLCVVWRVALRDRRELLPEKISGRTILLGALVTSPVWLAIVYLVPLPRALWTALPGHVIYQQLMQDAGIAVHDWLPVSVVPDASRASLLAGLPLVAAFMAGYLSRLHQLRHLLAFIVLIAFSQVLLGLMQIAGGEGSTLYFEANVFGRPVGTFANPNHLANFLAMALSAYICLARHNILNPEAQSGAPGAHFTTRHRVALWVTGATVLVIGILMTRSRGAATTGLPAGFLAAGLALLASRHRPGWRATLLLGVAIVAVAIALIGCNSLLSRVSSGDLASSVSFRSLLTTSTLAGAREFWPLGAGWGSYGAVYPRFQPVQIAGFADYAHNDYAQMLFEGGIFSLLLGTCFLWPAGSRALELSLVAIRARSLNPEQTTAALCGLGLLGFLVHSLIEFNMHIPANAMVGALLAGAFLRPLHYDRPA